MLKQMHWRVMGILFLAVAGTMAVASVVTSILKNSVIWILSFGNEEAAERASELSPWGYIAYWCVFAACVLGAFYMALLDIRYIRLQYALAKRDLLRETMGDGSLTSPSSDATPPSE